MLASGDRLRRGLPGADADLVALGVGQDVNDGASSSLTRVPPAASAASMRWSATAGSTWMSRCQRWRGSSWRVGLLEPRRGHPAVGVDDLEVLLVPVVAEDRGPERPRGLDVGRVEARARGSGSWRASPRRRAPAAMALMRRASAMSRSVTPRDVVAPQPHQDGRPGQRHVGVVVGLLGGRADARDELEARREAVGLVPRLERAHDQHPVGEALVVDLRRRSGWSWQHGLSDGARVVATSQRNPAGSAK